MIFSSPMFFLLFLILVPIYYLVKIKRQWIVLLIGSYIFYFTFGGYTIIFIFLSTIITFFSGKLIEKNQNPKLSPLSNEFDHSLQSKNILNKKLFLFDKKRILIFALLFNFGLLGYLKYLNFFEGFLNQLFTLASLKINITYSNVLLPIGISFYTFQAAGYLIDIYRGKIHAENNLGKLALFLSFFPQILQGPISRFNDLAIQFFTPHKFEIGRIHSGFQLIMWGFFKKMVIADRIALSVNAVFENYTQLDGIRILLGLIQYSIQIYCDFSGGIDIARGIAEIFGINLPYNFKRPFFAISVEDFWRRWHITLGAWMREYVFYPITLSKQFTRLGRLFRRRIGGRLSKLLPTALAMFITFIIIGLWHGPNLKFIAYGVYNGIFIFLGIVFTPFLEIYYKKLNINQNTFSWKLFQMLRTLLIISVGRLFSRTNGVTEAFSVIHRALKVIFPWSFFSTSNFVPGLDSKDSIVIIISLLIMFIIEIIQEQGVEIRATISRQNLPFRWLIDILLIFSVMIFGVYGITYNAVDFIYQGF